MKSIKVGNRYIGSEYPPFIVAEMSGNHNKSLDRALQIVEAAAKAGAHAIKLQTYTADTMTLDVNSPEFVINDMASMWNGRKLHSLYDEASTPWEWHKPIFDRCAELGMIGFSTPFDATSVEFLESLNVPVYKIASFEITDLPLIDRVARTQKPLIMSCGMSTVAEIDEAVSTARAAGCNEIVLLKCTSTYPAEPKNINLRTMPHMQALFKCQVGLSDHTMGVGTAVGAVALGATVIEKHFTLLRSEGGVDSVFSAEPDELAMLVKESENVWKSLGEIFYGPSPDEAASIRYRRSLYITEDMQEGDILTSNNIKIVRPGLGLAPKFQELILGRPIRKKATKGTPITWDLV